MTNFEVMTFLQQKKSNRIKPKGQLATIIYETMRYLKSTDCVYQSDESIKNFLKDVSQLPLPKMEKLTLVNIPPRSPIDVQTVIQFSEDVLTDEGVDQLISCASLHFPEPQQSEENSEEDVEAQ
ncbi:uncharacterized protein LOC123295231 [Chrysoperla carnea]|uniref:uncharacterized protein LOC123295231 n=1 Tax=Chrysoperla carnea TaxID=189513 RepID=UPI001D07AFE3|nr:uncharacterized protein LOC123295231 [Chrysoperla carnea]